MSELTTGTTTDQGTISSNLLSQEQQNWLNRRLANRPKKKSLKDRGLLPEGNPEVRRNKDRDSLSRNLEQRPGMQKLIQTGILNSHHSGLSSTLVATAKKLERTLIADDLNQKLYSREDMTFLQKKGILQQGDVAPMLQNNKLKLERAFKKDKLNHQLYTRPERQELVAKSILPAGMRSSVVERSIKTLEKNMRRDKIGHLLEKRKDLGELLNSNVIKDPRIASSLQAKQHELEKSLVKSNLYHALKSRPSVEDLRQKGYYQSSLPGDEEDRLKEYVASENVDDYKRALVQPKFDQSRQEYLQRRSKSFHLTRILLKFVASMSQAGKISLDQKGQLKDLIVDQDKTILAVAETFDVENDLNDFEDSLVRLASR